LPAGQETIMSTEGSPRPEAATPKAQELEIQDLPRSEEELAAAQAEEVGGGAVATSGLGVCWLEQKQLDSCWIENNGQKVPRINNP